MNYSRISRHTCATWISSVPSRLEQQRWTHKILEKQTSEAKTVNEWEAMKQLNNNTNINSSNNTQLEDENRRLRKELNELKLKEVERQQGEFGVGIND